MECVLKNKWIKFEEDDVTCHSLILTRLTIREAYIALISRYFLLIAARKANPTVGITGEKGSLILTAQATAFDQHLSEEFNPLIGHLQLRFV